MNLGFISEQTWHARTTTFSTEYDIFLLLTKCSIRVTPGLHKSLCKLCNLSAVIEEKEIRAAAAAFCFPERYAIS